MLVLHAAQVRLGLSFRGWRHSCSSILPSGLPRFWGRSRLSLPAYIMRGFAHGFLIYPFFAVVVYLSCPATAKNVHTPHVSPTWAQSHAIEEARWKASDRATLHRRGKIPSDRRKSRGGRRPDPPQTSLGLADEHGGPATSARLASEIDDVTQRHKVAIAIVRSEMRSSKQPARGPLPNLPHAT